MRFGIFEVDCRVGELRKSCVKIGCKNSHCKSCYGAGAAPRGPVGAIRVVKVGFSSAAGASGSPESRRLFVAADSKVTDAAPRHSGCPRATIDIGQPPTMGNRPIRDMGRMVSW